jgi:hypothetical protein
MLMRSTDRLTSRMPLSFVTFHADLSVDGGAHPHTDLEQSHYAEMISMLWASARRTHPGSTFTIMTTSETDLGALGEAVSRKNFTVAAESLMQDRMACQIEFLSEAEFDKPIVFLDSDVLINGPLDEVFAGDFDVGLTWRRLEEMPFNGGVLFVNNRRKGPAEAFMRSVYDLYQRRHGHRAKWFGDQTAIYEYLGVSPDEIVRCPTLEKDGCRFAFFPCETHNYSPENGLAEILRPLDEKIILHFKGARKSLMGPYFRAYIGYHPDRPLDAIRRWRARSALKAMAAADLMGEAST